MFLLCNITVQGISLFMPTLLAGMGYSKIQSQLLTVPPYILSSIWAICIAYACQRTGKRGLWTLVTTPLSILGSAMLIGSKDRKVEYAGIFFLAIGSKFCPFYFRFQLKTQYLRPVFPLGPIFLAWGSNNSAPYTTRAVSSAMIVSIGSLGPIISSWIYLPRDGYVLFLRISVYISKPATLSIALATSRLSRSSSVLKSQSSSWPYVLSLLSLWRRYLPATSKHADIPHFLAHAREQASSRR